MKHRPIKLDSLALDGMGQHLAAMSEAIAEQAGADLSAQMLQPRADISSDAGEMERESPLFFGTGDNPSLF